MGLGLGVGCVASDRFFDSVPVVYDTDGNPVNLSGLRVFPILVLSPFSVFNPFKAVNYFFVHGVGIRRCSCSG